MQQYLMLIVLIFLLLAGWGTALTFGILLVRRTRELGQKEGALAAHEKAVEDYKASMGLD